MSMRWMAMLCVALILGAPGIGQGKTVTYIHTDALGSPVLETNQAGQVVRQVDHRAYGEEVMSGPQEGPGYTGHYRDYGTGFVYMQQRYYDPVAGRFLSVDPIEPQASGGNFNRYWYANNNPLAFVDPDGRYGIRRGELDWRCGGGTGGVCDGSPQVGGAFFDGGHVSGDQMANYEERFSAQFSDPAIGDANTEAGTELVISMIPFGVVVRGTYRLVQSGRFVERLASSRRLSKNLEAAGYIRTTGDHAHHIVAHGSPYAAEGRQILRNFGVGIDDAANGVFLPGAIHRSMHNESYYRMVNSRLSGAGSRDEVLEVLHMIRLGIH